MSILSGAIFILGSSFVSCEANAHINLISLKFFNSFFFNFEFKLPELVLMCRAALTMQSHNNHK